MLEFFRSLHDLPSELTHNPFLLRMVVDIIESHHAKEGQSSVVVNVGGESESPSKANETRRANDDVLAGIRSRFGLYTRWMRVFCCSSVRVLRARGGKAFLYC